MSKHNRERRQRKGREKYMADMLARAQEQRLQPGRLYMVNVQHDDWCALLAGKGECNCNPDVGALKPLPLPEDN